MSAELLFTGNLPAPTHNGTRAGASKTTSSGFFAGLSQSSESNSDSFAKLLNSLQTKKSSESTDKSDAQKALADLISALEKAAQQQSANEGTDIGNTDNTQTPAADLRERLAALLKLQEGVKNNSVLSDSYLITTDVTGADGQPQPANLLLTIFADNQQDFKTLSDQLSQILGQLQKLAQNSTDGGLLITNLTPAQATDIMDSLQKNLSEQDLTSVDSDSYKKIQTLLQLIEGQNVDENAQDPITLERVQKALDTLRKNGADADQKAIDRLEAITTALQTAKKLGQEPTLHIANNTLNDKAQAKDKSKDGTDNSNSDIISLFFGFAQLVVPQDKTALNQTKGQQGSNDALTQAAGSQKPSTGQTQNSAMNALESAALGAQGTVSATDSESGDTQNFAKFLRDRTAKGNADDRAAIHQTGSERKAANAASLQGIFGLGDTTEGGLYSTSSSTSSDVLTQAGAIGSINALNSGSAMALSSPLTQAANAALPHPATQVVMGRMQQAAQKGEDTTMTLQLDPPELGRVEIKMSFDKHNKVKAVLTAEKSDTFNLLQRDSHLLEQALRDSGVDADGGLSFQLADSGFDFSGNSNNRGGGHDNGGTGAGSGGDDADIINTTMTWQVDPNTGHMRYNILA